MAARRHFGGVRKQRMTKLERLMLWFVALALLANSAQAVVRITSDNSAGGTNWFQIVGLPTANRALCVDAAGQVGQCTISLATGLCTLGCTIP